MCESEIKEKILSINQTTYRRGVRAYADKLGEILL